MPLEWIATGTVTAPATPLTFLSNVWGWYPADQEPVVANATLMSQMTDQSGNGRHGTASGTNRPEYETNASGSLPAYKFTSANGTNFALPSMSALTEAHFFIVLKMLQDNSTSAGLNNGPWWMGSAGAGDTYFAFTDLNIYDGWGSTTRNSFGKGGVLLDAWRAYEVESSLNNWRARLDGTQLFSTASNTVDFSGGPFIGVNSLNRPASFSMVEMAICSSVQSSGERAAWAAYINSKFSLSTV